MREIKFRGKRIFDGSWAYGDMLHNSSNVPAWIMESHNPNSVYINIDPETVGQFTGSRQNDTDFYEGDIMSFTVFDYNGADTQYTGVIKWCGSRFMIWHDNDQEFYGADGAFDLDWVIAQHDEPEVIGNIYENPELVKEV